jgi:predicted kinase
VTRAICVAGPAGSGKTTLGVALARSTGAAVVDLDVLTNPLLAVVAELVGAGEDLDHPSLRGPVREARYGCLVDTAAAQLELGLDVVLVAPFTAESAETARWQVLTSRLARAGADRVHLVWLDLPATQREARLRARAAPRDAARLADPAALARWVEQARPPQVAALRVDASTPVDLQVETVLRALAPPAT